uniref:Uncharacterized protein n=1 Tax=Anguilla anguilla TaxID=7936 RepID=A0A0E9UIX5_ANGAN
MSNILQDESNLLFYFTESDIGIATETKQNRKLTVGLNSE